MPLVLSRPAGAPPPRPGRRSPATGGAVRLASFAEAIKFSHSVFALPFALIAMLVAADGWPGWTTLLLIVIACVAARTAAMCFNRIADADIDARNPRTRTRALVTGELSRDFMIRATIVSSLVFFLAAGLLNFTCLLLAPPTLGVLFFYSLTKRFTRWSHLFLGLALGLAPAGAWVAVTGRVEALPIILSLAVMGWVAGFDILYACQDYDSDRRERSLHSIPKALGIAGAMRLARRIHVAAYIAFLVFLAASPLGGWFLLGLLATGALLVHQHRIVSPDDLSRINAAFFTSNGLISIGLLAMAILDHAARG